MRERARRAGVSLLKDYFLLIWGSGKGNRSARGRRRGIWEGATDRAMKGGGGGGRGEGNKR